MTEAAERYAGLMRRLLDGRARREFDVGTPGESREDGLLEQMDECWWKMTEAERAEAQQRLDDSRRVDAPPELLVVDVEIGEGATVMPREVAA